MLASRAIRLYGDENFGMLAMCVAGNSLLIFRPEPRGDRFLDVGESLLFVFPLRHASGQRRAFDDNPTIFRLIERDVKDHADIVPTATRRYNAGWLQSGLSRTGEGGKTRTPGAPQGCGTSKFKSWRTRRSFSFAFRSCILAEQARST